jgi:hypothetical protein
LNYVRDNTVSDPSTIIGTLPSGTAYLVPPAGAAGAWAEKEDFIAVWGGSIWSFVEPAAGTEYQIESGPNAGKIYTRTSAVNIRAEIIPDSNLQQPLEGYPDWELITTGSGTAVWSTGIITLETPASASHSATALVTIPTVPGSSYNLAYVLDTLDFSGAGKIARITIRELPSLNIITDPELEISDALVFTAVTDSTSIAISVTNTSEATTASEVVISSLSVKRISELMANGDLSSDAGWTIETPWVIDDGYAFASIDYSGHEPFPALRKSTLNSLVVGRFYRIGFSAIGNFQRGILSIFAGDTFTNVLLGDVSTSGDHTFFFKAPATTTEIEFPLTKVGPSVFEVTLDDVTVSEALWIASPVIQAAISGKCTMVCGVSVSPPLTVRIPAVSGMICVCTTEVPVGPVIAAKSSLFANTQVTTSVYTSALIAAKSSMTVGNLGGNVFISAVIAAKSSISCKTVDLGDYTVAMAIDSITELWSLSGCSCTDDGCGPLQVAALECLNAAMQRLNASGREWGFVSNVAMTLGPKTSLDGEIDLPKDVIAVRRVVFRPALDSGATVFGSFVLNPIRSRPSLEGYRLSSDRLSWPLTAAESALKNSVLPIGYFVEGEDSQGATASGPPNLRLLFAPILSPARSYKVDIQAHIAPPRLTCGNLLDGSVMPVPHRFVETLLLPLAKYYALSNRWFRRPELSESIQLQARDALLLTGEIQPAAAEAGKEQRGGSAK